MPERSTSDHISALRLLIEYHREYRKDRHLFIAFIDLKAAFDTVDRPTLWKILQVLGLPPKLTTLLTLLYDGAESCVRVNGKESDWFPISAGVRQGCVAAPDLFNCIIDHLMTAVCDRLPGIQLGDYHLTDLDYADDTTLFCNSRGDMERALTIFGDEATRLGLRVNWQKTKLMYVGDGPDPPPINIGAESVEFVPSFVYLGSEVTNDGNILTEVNRRRGLAAGVMRSLWRPLWRRRDISRRTKLRVYNAAVLSVLLYGAETWPLCKTLASRVRGFDSRALRTIEGVRWYDHVTNEELRERTGQANILRVLAQRRVRWLGHVLRRPDDHPTKATYEFDPTAAGWRRPRGRPRTRWKDVLRSDLQGVNLTLEDAARLADDRVAWRGLVDLVGSTPCWHED